MVFVIKVSVAARCMFVCSLQVRVVRVWVGVFSFWAMSHCRSVAGFCASFANSVFGQDKFCASFLCVFLLFASFWYSCGGRFGFCAAAIFRLSLSDSAIWCRSLVGHLGCLARVFSISGSGFGFLVCFCKFFMG